VDAWHFQSGNFALQVACATLTPTRSPTPTSTPTLTPTVTSTPAITPTSAPTTQLDQSSSNDNAINCELGFHWQQEVIAGIAGQLTGVELYVETIGTANIYINRGAPWQSDANEYHTAFSPSATGWHLFDVAHLGLNFNVGDRFVIGVQGTGGLWLGGNSNLYPGILYISGSEFSYVDLAFRTYMLAGPVPTATPTVTPTRTPLATLTPTRTPTVVPAPPWEFNSDGDTEGWYPANAMGGLTVSGGALTATLTGTDPFMYSASNQTIFAAANPYIIIRYRTALASSGEFFFSSSVRPGVQFGNEVYFTVIGGNTFHVCSVNMAANPYWGGTIDLLRLDPVVSGTGAFEIDYIRLAGAPVPTETPAATITPTATPTQPPVPTATQVPSATPVPSPSPTPDVTATPAPCVSTGDVNHDGQVTPGDAQQAFFFYLDCAGLNPTAMEYCQADYCSTGPNTPCDGSVTPADALGIMKAYLGMPDPCVK